VDRRQFLRLAARSALGAGAATVAAACTRGGLRPSGPPRSTPFPTVRPSGSITEASSPGPPTPADWDALARSLDGSLIRPGDPSYDTARELFNPRFDSLRPAGIVQCGSVADVRRSVAFVREHGLPIAARSGGHSYAGYSSGAGLLCDVGALAGVTVDAGAGTAVVGAGARLIDVYAALAPHGLAVPGGSCPTVGIAGLTLGGGQGVVGRKLGLTCDNLTSLQIVTAAGEVLTCGPDQHADLFWACRGGGGGNFGIVTSFTFEARPLTSLTLFSLHWAWPDAHAVVAAWQGWAPTAPDELWSNCHLLSTADRGPGITPIVSTGGVYVGSASALSPLLQDLIDAAGVQPTSSSVGTHSYLDAMLIEAGCSGKTVPQCHLPTQDPQGTLAREASKAKSDFFSRPLPGAGIDAVLRAVEARQADPRMSTVAGAAFDAFGGAINRVPASATAFVHRDALFLAQYNATWPEDASAGVVRANVDWLNGMYADVHGFADGFAYQNYIDPDLAGWERAYYGSNLPRLSRVKAAYDPDGVFRFAQAIPPPR
jgi:FAD/FMN-containing dehydrogenase